MMDGRKTIEEDLSHTDMVLQTLWRLIVEQVNEVIKVQTLSRIHFQTESGILQVEDKASELESERCQ
jgi:glucose-6-phosphate-specific signal transduction histidine kinase